MVWWWSDEWVAFLVVTVERGLGVEEGLLLVVARGVGAGINAHFLADLEINQVEGVGVVSSSQVAYDGGFGLAAVRGMPVRRVLASSHRTRTRFTCVRCRAQCQR